MKTKKCKVHITPTVLETQIQLGLNLHKNLPGIMRGTYLFLDLVDEEDHLIASTLFTDGSTAVTILPVSQSFIDKYIKMNGEIEEVLIEMEEMSNRPKISSKGTVIIHPVKSEISISNIPVKAIKDLLNQIEVRCTSFGETDFGASYNKVNGWLEENSL